MAAVPAVYRDLIVVKSPYDGSGSSTKRQAFVLFVDAGGTDVAGGTDTLDVDVPTLLAAHVHSGRTYTVRSFALWQTCRNATADYAATMTNSTGVLSLTPKSVSNWSSNATITGATTVDQPYGVYVLCDLS